MANAAMGAQTAPSGSTPASGYQNPFWSASNYYAEKNNQQIPVTQLTTSAAPFSLLLNATGFLRKARFLVASAGGVGGTVTPDNPWNLFQQLDLEDTDGGPIIFPQSGYNHMLYAAYGRPWEGNPFASWDYAQSINPSFTMALSPEIRHTAGVLLNTDSRSQYKVTGSLAPQATLASGTISTATTITSTLFIDTWAQPDPNDLQGTANIVIPPGVNLQTKKRHVLGTLNGAGSDNIIQANPVCGNEIRLAMLVIRDGSNNRQDYLTDPIQWYLDNRKLSNFSPNLITEYMQDFYGTGALPRPQGVYVFPRFFNPGDLKGQGWLQTNNSSNLRWESTTASALSGTGTTEVIVDEVIPVGQIPATLDHI